MLQYLPRPGLTPPVSILWRPLACALSFQSQFGFDTLFHDEPGARPRAMNLQLNHLNAKAAAITPIVVEALQKLVSDGHIDPAQFATLQVQLDWVQYKQNFREMVEVSHIGRQNGEPRLPTMDMRIDTRQVTPETLRPEMLRALSLTDADRIPLEDFKSFRNSIAWEFNKRYW